MEHSNTENINGKITETKDDRSESNSSYPSSDESYCRICEDYFNHLKSRRYKCKSPRPYKRSDSTDRIKSSPSKDLGVFGLSPYTLERDLDNVFSKYGKVESSKIIYDYITDRSKGFGFVSFSSIDEAITARMKLDGYKLHGKAIRVDYSISRPYKGGVDYNRDRYRNHERNYRPSTYHTPKSSRYEYRREY